MVVGYRELKNTPAATVRRIAARFGLPEPEGDLERELRTLGATPYRSPHRYGLEQFGLVEEQIREPLAEVFERHHGLFG